MLGNVSELCSDWKGNISPEPQTDPTGAASPLPSLSRVVRGGSLRDPLARCYDRMSSAEETIPHPENGFRVCVEVAKPDGAGNDKRTDPNEEIN